MIYIVSSFLQRSESYAYENNFSYVECRLVSQPENVYGLKIDACDRIIVVGQVSNRLWGALEAARSKSPEPKPVIERAWSK